MTDDLFLYPFGTSGARVLTDEKNGKGGIFVPAKKDLKWLLKNRQQHFSRDWKSEYSRDLYKKQVENDKKLMEKIKKAIGKGML